LNLTSIKFRFLFSVLANALRAAITFSSGVLVARGLSPSGYGDITFMLGSFVAIRALLDMGTSSAFYTFLSKTPRGYRFYSFYFLWLLLQFVITILLVSLLIPNGMFEKIWLGHLRETVALAFVASFMQQQVWQMAGQIGESSRKTVQVQLLNIAVAVTYLAIISWLSIYGHITVDKILWITVFLYGIGTIASYRFLVVYNAQPTDEYVTIKQLLVEYRDYCKPMIGLAIAGFLYTFIDKWMLQKFGGSVQQGYFQIASQFAQVSLLATVSILNIFWKEIAEATAKKDHGRVATLYLKINRGLVMLSATIAGLLLPWSKQIVTILLGQNYTDAWVVVAIMFLYPIHQSMGQIGGTMFMAGGDTRKYMILSICIMLFTLPLSYFAMAPTVGMLIPGLGLGAMGMACYMVISGVFSVNVQAWVIARHHGWKFDWLYQVIGIPTMLLLGYVAKVMAVTFWNLEGAGLYGLIIPILFSCILYGMLVALVLWFFPWLAGIDKMEMQVLLRKWWLGRRRNEIH
jgi:O-antigen/teichoic acid export membrane protein